MAIDTLLIYRLCDTIQLVFVDSLPTSSDTEDNVRNPALIMPIRITGARLKVECML